MACELIAIRLACVLRAAVAVMNHSGARASVLDRHRQCGGGEILQHAISHRSPHNAPRAKIDHDGQVKPTTPRRNMRDICSPNPIYIGAAEWP